MTHCEQSGAVQWMVMPAQYAVMQIYHFRDTICSVKRNLDRAPTLKKHVDVAAIEAALTKLITDFPNWLELRDCVGHFVDKVYTQAKITRHMPERGAFYHGVMEGRSLRVVAP